MKVALIRHTLSPEEVVALGARLCYSKARVDDLLERVEARDQTAFVHKIMGMGHDSVLEHASFTFGIEGVSRVLLAQITRHRLASFSVQSQRYVSYEQGLLHHRRRSRRWGRMLSGVRAADGHMHHGTPLAQEARKCERQEGRGFVLPVHAETRMMGHHECAGAAHSSACGCAPVPHGDSRPGVEMHRLCMEVAPRSLRTRGRMPAWRVFRRGKRLRQDAGDPRERRLAGCFEQQQRIVEDREKKHGILQ